MWLWLRSATETPLAYILRTQLSQNAAFYEDHSSKVVGPAYGFMREAEGGGLLEA